MQKLAIMGTGWMCHIQKRPIVWFAEGHVIYTWADNHLRRVASTPATYLHCARRVSHLSNNISPSLHFDTFLPFHSPSTPNRPTAMPLRRLELSNFKSYRGAQVIDFGDDPFTCIIGPNGSGKSNLMDAISFVLGIKSQQLRSTKLADLVYRGRKAAEGAQELGLDVEVPETQQSQSQSQSQLGPNDARNASVAIVFQDDNGREWNFRRTMSAAGGASSVYSLNGKTVGWGEYNKQLEKFNILVKAKNFLVFQGDVENVASQDSKKLSELIDRISG